MEPGSTLEQVLKAKLGVSWSVNQNSNLSFNSPKFIGYRIAQFIKGQQGYKTMKMAGPAEEELQIKDIPIDELREAAK